MSKEKLNFKLIKNPYYYPFYRKYFKKINNTSLVIIWRNSKTRENKYLIQKRSKNMKRGKNRLAIGGGMLEKSDKTLQAGAIREVLEESQIQFKKNNNLSKDTINMLEPYLFPLKNDKNNITFFLIIVSKNQPKIKGPLKTNKIKPFLKSEREIDIDDHLWDNKKLEGKINNGHAFLNRKEILYHYKKGLEIWKYTKDSLNLIFDILE
jgi:hypothetical protein